MKPYKLQKIDESLLSEHSCLSSTDYCYFLGEYASGKRSQYGEINHLIINLKKPMDRKALPEWRYKQRAIVDAAYLLASTSAWAKLKTCTWVAVPSSKAKSDPEYDDRLVQVMHKLKEIEPSLDARELILIKSSREAAHSTGSKRLSVKEHLQNFILDPQYENPFPERIVIFDDVLTSGASFKAAQEVLLKKFPGVFIIGIFIARNVKVLD